MERFKLRLLPCLAILILAINTNFAADHTSAAGAGGDSSLSARLSDWWVSLSPDRSLISAVKDSNLAGVQQALRLGANPNIYTEEEQYSSNHWNSMITNHAVSVILTEPLLCYCIRARPNLQIVTALLIAGADLSRSIKYCFKVNKGNAAYSDYVVEPAKYTDLFSAIEKVDESILEVLVRHISTAVVRNQALLMACRLGYGKIVAQLISAGVNINYSQMSWFLIKDHDIMILNTPLALAVKYDRIAIVKILLAAGVQVNQPLTNDYGIVALAKSPAVLNLLIAAGANINAQSSLNNWGIYRPNKKDLIKILIAAGAKVTGNAYRYHTFVAKAYKEVIENSSKLQSSLATESLKSIMQAIYDGVRAEDIQIALQKLVTDIKSDAIYEIIDSLILNKIDLKFKDKINCSLLDCAILANNYKAVDALLLQGFDEHDLHPDTIPNLLACSALKQQSSAAGAALSSGSTSFGLDHAGNVTLGEYQIGGIIGWSKAVDSSIEQLCLPNLYISDLNQDICERIGVDSTQVEEFAKSCLILKMLQDLEIAHYGLAAIAAVGGDTGFTAGSVPVRYTAVKRHKILEILRMQLAERDSCMAGLQSVAMPVRAARIDPEFGIEMVPMHGGRERYANVAAGRHPLQNANGGWSEGKDSE